MILGLLLNESLQIYIFIKLIRLSSRVTNPPFIIQLFSYLVNCQ